MTTLVDLLENKPVFVDDRSGELGGSFYMNPHLQPYSPLPIKWAYERLVIYDNPTLIDVGASTGAFTLLARHLANLNVHAFEPVKLAADVLKENCYLNAVTNRVQINQVAVSNYDGNGLLHTIRQLGGLGVSMVDGTPNPHKEVDSSSVPVVRLDTYCELNYVQPHMIKIDCEGSELMVLHGAIETIKKFKPFLTVEYSEENTQQYNYHAREIIEFIESLGYFWTLPEVDILAVHKDWQDIK